MGRMKIAHFSDWHAKLHILPKADVYVCTGDMLPNFSWNSNRDIEVARQHEWCLAHPFRREVGLDDQAPVVVVKGNHDFISLADWIGGDVWEVTDDPIRTTTLFGLKFGGFRGVNPIDGRWTDEIDLSEMSTRSVALPMDLNVLLTHCGPDGIMSGPWGSVPLTAYLQRRSYLEKQDLLAHCFGHVHECSGMTKTDLFNTIYSNAACTLNVFEI